MPDREESAAALLREMTLPLVVATEILESALYAIADLARQPTAPSQAAIRVIAREALRLNAYAGAVSKRWIAAREALRR